jgi:hypothetical protein
MLYEAGTVPNQRALDSVNQWTGLLVETVTAASGSYEVGPLGLVLNDELD